MFTNGEDLFRLELERVIASIDRRLDDQRALIAALRAAHKSVRTQQARLRMLDECRGRLQALSSNLGHQRLRTLPLQRNQPH
jgi:hypothetical protein